MSEKWKVEREKWKVERGKGKEGRGWRKQKGPRFYMRVTLGVLHPYKDKTPAFKVRRGFRIIAARSRIGSCRTCGRGCCRSRRRPSAHARMRRAASLWMRWRLSRSCSSKRWRRSSSSSTRSRSRSSAERRAVRRLLSCLRRFSGSWSRSGSRMPSGIGTWTGLPHLTQVITSPAPR